MNLNVVIALFMGLVIQLSQVHGSWSAAGSGKSCGASGHAPSCCDDHQSCPCVDEGAPNQKPAPLVPATIDLKPLLSQVPESIHPAALFSPPKDAVAPAASKNDARRGYAGVPLSVAFCSFVI